MKARPSAFFVCAISLWFLGAAIPCRAGGTSTPKTDSKIEALIDQLTQISHPGVGYNGDDTYGGFIALNGAVSFQSGILGNAPPTVSPTLQKIVRMGAAALPTLIAHLTDARPTELVIKHQMLIGSMWVEAEYDPRYHLPPANWQDDFETPNLNPNDNDPNGPFQYEKKDVYDISQDYTIRVGDLCYGAIGQIVNRELTPIRYQMTACIVVNSPVFMPKLAEETKKPDVQVVVCLTNKVQVVGTFRVLNPERRNPMDLDTLIITVFCTLDDAMNACFAGKKLRRSGPQTILEDSEVLTMEAVGAFLGISQEEALFAFFLNHYAHFFPALGKVHRTTFTRQATNLWKVKERLWLHLLDRTPHDERFHIIDSFPLPVCRFARAPRCRRFRGEAAYGHDAVARQTFYGFRFHAVVAWPGVIVRLCLAPGNEQELAVTPQLAQGIQGQLLGDRNYWSPELRQELSKSDLDLVAPYRNKSKDPWPMRSHLLSILRYRIDTVFGQLTERFGIKKVGAKDLWHMASRLLRTVLSHTLMVYLNVQQGNEPLQLEKLVTT